jgi:hypothetical protein
MHLGVCCAVLGVAWAPPASSVLSYQFTLQYTTYTMTLFCYFILKLLNSICMRRAVQSSIFNLSYTKWDIPELYATNVPEIIHGEDIIL